MLRLYVALAGLVALASAEILYTGNCAKVNYPTNINAEQISGIWYEVAGTPHKPDMQPSCLKHVFTAHGETSYTQVTTGKRNEVDFKKVRDGEVRRSSDGSMTILSMLPRPEIPFSNYYIVEWQSENVQEKYMVLWKCIDLETNQHTERMRVLARTKTLSRETYENIQKNMKKMGILLEGFQIIDQDC